MSGKISASVSATAKLTVGIADNLSLEEQIEFLLNRVEELDESIHNLDSSIQRID